MKVWQKIQSLGINPQTDIETAKIIRIVNIMSVFSIGISWVICIYSLLSPLPFFIFLFSMFMGLGLLIPLALNHHHQTFSSRLFFLFYSYFIIICLPILFGPELHFQYYLMGGIGMPLIFFRNEIGFWKILLSAVAILFWMYLEWHFTQFPALIKVDPASFYGVRIINDLLVFLTILSVVYIFTQESSKHLAKIEEKSIALTNSLDDFKEVNQELEELVYSVSHNLRAPIRHIEAYTTQLKKVDSHNISEAGNTHLGKVSYSVKRLAKMTDSLLKYARSRNAKPNKTSIDSNQLISRILEDFKTAHPDQSIQWQVADLPASYADPSMLHEVWENLISNAIKYSSNEAQPLIKIKSEEVGDDIIFSIQDNGVGFNKQYQNKLFTIFQRLHKQSEFPGHGIGLANVARILQIHGGKIRGESTLGDGATFYFSLPKGDS